MDWNTFEHASIIYHAQKYPHETWHWSKIPETVLYDSGYIHTYNEWRLAKLLAVEQNSGRNPLRDVGFDGLSCEIIDEKRVYHGLQAKYYSRNLGPGDVGTFLMKCGVLQIRNPLSRGYIYYTRGLTSNLRADLSLYNNAGKHIIDERLTVEQLNSIIPLLEHSKVEDSLMINETGYELTESQHAHIKQLCDGTGKQLLHRPCGTGKTLIIGHVLQRKMPAHIIVIAPLRISIDNLYRRIPAFLPNYATLLVDSDTIGTTDIDVITKSTANERWILFTTFKSAKEIIANLYNRKIITCDYIIIDEVHNISNSGILSKFANNIDNGIYMTATPTHKLDKILTITSEVKYSLAQAIKDKVVCDYQVHIPIMTDDQTTDCIIPDEFSDLPKDMVNKAMFLSNGLLQTGSHKCIGYFRSIKECIIFKDVFQKILLEYHGLTCKLHMINEKTSITNRRKILHEFDDPTNTDIHLLLSVRILDESVDLKRCDSEFISYTGDKKCDIRTIQRMMRGCRIDPCNPSKVNNLFIWANIHNDNALHVFSLLQSFDDKFIDKIHSLSSDYDNQTSTCVKQKITKQDAKLPNYIIKCMSLYELAVYKAHLLLEYIGIYRKLPPTKCIYKNIKLGVFWECIVNDHNKDIYTTILIHNDMLRADYDEKRLNKQTKHRFTNEERAELLCEYVEVYGKIPPTDCIYKGAKIRMYWNNILAGRNKHIYETFLCKNEILRNEYEQKQLTKLVLTERITSDQRAILTLEYTEKYGKSPHKKCVYKNVHIGNFWSSTKQGINPKLYETVLSKNNILKQNYDKCINIRLKKRGKTIFTPTDMANLTIEYTEKYNKIPPTKCVYNGANIGTFWMNTKRGQNKNIYNTILVYNETLRENYDEYVKKKQDQHAQPVITTLDRANLTLEYTEKYKKSPACKCVYKGVKIGSFWGSIKQGMNADIYNTLLKYNDILRENYESSAADREIKSTVVKITAEERTIAILEYATASNKSPVKNTIHKGIKIGQFWQRICYRGCHKTLYEKYLKPHPLLRAEYERINPQ